LGLRDAAEPFTTPSGGRLVIAGNSDSDGVVIVAQQAGKTVRFLTPGTASQILRLNSAGDLSAVLFGSGIGFDTSSGTLTNTIDFNVNQFADDLNGKKIVKPGALLTNTVLSGAVRAAINGGTLVVGDGGAARDQLDVKDGRFTTSVGTGSHVWRDSSGSDFAYILGNSVDANTGSLAFYVKQVGAQVNCFNINSSGNVEVLRQLTIPGQTANRVAVFNASKNVVSGTMAEGQVLNGDKGDITVSGALGDVWTIDSVNSNVGTFGNSTTIPVVTVNAKGQVTAVTTQAVSGGGGGGPRYVAMALSNPTVPTLSVAQTNYLSLPVAYTIAGVQGKLLNAGTGATPTILTLRNGRGGSVISTLTLAAGANSVDGTGPFNASVGANAQIVGDITQVGTGSPCGAQIVIVYNIP